MKTDVVRVRLSELHTKQLTVPSWETDVLRAVHGAAAVKVIDHTDRPRDPPDAAAEYERLESRYGGDAESGTSYVAQVYGQHSTGVARLSAAIANAVTTKTPKPVSSPKPIQRPGAPVGTAPAAD